MRLLLEMTVLPGLAAAVGAVFIEMADSVDYAEAMAIARHRAADALT